ncbi:MULTISPECIES: hypothetical protein [Clostridium]|nr:MULTISPECIES: hypothetical protein [Clostridium]
MEISVSSQQLINEILDKFIRDMKEMGFNNSEIIKNTINSLKKMEA